MIIYLKHLICIYFKHIIHSLDNFAKNNLTTIHRFKRLESEIEFRIELVFFIIVSG